jgi:hypothetical protein
VSQILTPDNDCPQVPRRTSLYRYFDSLGVLLYVGITDRGNQRNSEHDKSKNWWTFVARQEVSHFETREDALAAERACIAMHRPPFNKQHNPDHDKTKAAYLSYVGGLNTADPRDVLERVGRKIHLRRATETPLREGWEYTFITDPLAATVAERMVLPEPLRTQIAHKEWAVLQYIAAHPLQATLTVTTKHTRLASDGHFGHIKFHCQKPLEFKFKSLTLRPAPKDVA